MGEKGSQWAQTGLISLVCASQMTRINSRNAFLTHNSFHFGSFLVPKRPIFKVYGEGQNRLKPPIWASHVVPFLKAIIFWPAVNPVDPF